MALARSRGGRRYRAAIRRGKGAEVHLGIYETPWLASFAYRAAAEALGREVGPAVQAPVGEQPTAEEVRWIAEVVRRRLGLAGTPRRGAAEIPPDAEDLLIFFEVTVVGFWRGQVATDAEDPAGAGLDGAAGRLAEAARLLFWSRSAGHPMPREALAGVLGRRLDAVFRRGDVARAILDDDGDDDWRVARWLVYPDRYPYNQARGFRDEVRFLYHELFAGRSAGEPGPLPGWAVVLGVEPPFSAEQVRSAYRARSRAAHPDAGGSDAAFVRLQAAYDEALEYGVALGW